MRKESFKNMELVLSSDHEHGKFHPFRLNLNVCVVVLRIVSALPSSQTNIPHHRMIVNGFRCKKELIRTLPSRVTRKHDDQFIKLRRIWSVDVHSFICIDAAFKAECNDRLVASSDQALQSSFKKLSRWSFHVHHKNNSLWSNSITFANNWCAHTHKCTAASLLQFKLLCSRVQSLVPHFTLSLMPSSHHGSSGER